MTKAVDSMQQDVATRAAVALPLGQAAALLVDWDRGDLDDLRRMMSRMDVDLETAVQVFFNGAPARYNMIAKSDLLPQAQARCNLLDSIHRRIACGFYLPDPAQGLGRARADAGLDRRARP